MVSIKKLKVWMDARGTNSQWQPIGLIIVKAWYGCLDNVDFESDELPEEVIDVTVVVQALVNESRVTIPGGHSKVSDVKSI